MSNAPTRLAIIGAAGRMGTSLLANAAERGDLVVGTAIVAPGDNSVGPLGPEAIEATTDLDSLVGLDVAIDFSTPDSCLRSARKCAELGLAFVSGTTGLSSDQLAELMELSTQIALLHSANFSVGVNLLAHLVELAASGFGDEVDIEIFEAHHRHKVDAPSGTAKLLGRAAAKGRNLDLESAARWSREGHTGPRTDDEIGFQVLRGGDIVGEHTAYFCVDGERLELTHRATDRAIFARGALRAARWLHGRQPAKYDMTDVLFEK